MPPTRVFAWGRIGGGRKGAPPIPTSTAVASVALPVPVSLIPEDDTVVVSLRSSQVRSGILGLLVQLVVIDRSLLVGPATRHESHQAARATSKDRHTFKNLIRAWAVLVLVL
jgi:hypothetical protein